MLSLSFCFEAMIVQRRAGDQLVEDQFRSPCVAGSQVRCNDPAYI